MSLSSKLDIFRSIFTDQFFNPGLGFSDFGFVIRFGKHLVHALNQLQQMVGANPLDIEISTILFDQYKHHFFTGALRASFHNRPLNNSM